MIGTEVEREKSMKKKKNVKRREDIIIIITTIMKMIRNYIKRELMIDLMNQRMENYVKNIHIYI